MAEHIQFPPFELDPESKRLWRDGQECAVTPKPLEVLCYLVSRAGELVTKEEVLEAVWPDTVVSDGVLKRHIRDLRTILADDPNQPQFIETLPRQGYRFIADVGARPSPPNPQQQTQRPPVQLSQKRVPAPQPLNSALVGREGTAGFSILTASNRLFRATDKSCLSLESRESEKLH